MTHDEVFTDTGDRGAATAFAMKVTDLNINMTVPWFLMTCYLYYIQDVSVVEDLFFDKMCKRMLDNWDRIEHPHKRLIGKADLAAGTGYYLNSESYPAIVIGGADRIARKYGFTKEVPRRARAKRRRRSGKI